MLPISLHACRLGRSAVVAVIALGLMALCEQEAHAKKPSEPVSKPGNEVSGLRKQKRLTDLFNKARGFFGVQEITEEDSVEERWKPFFKEAPPSTTIDTCSAPTERTARFRISHKDDTSPLRYTIVTRVNMGTTTEPASRRRFELIWIQQAEDGTNAESVAKGRLSESGEAVFDGLLGDDNVPGADFESFGHFDYVLQVDGAVVHVFRIPTKAPRYGMFRCSYWTDGNARR